MTNQERGDRPLEENTVSGSPSSSSVAGITQDMRDLFMYLLRNGYAEEAWDFILWAVGSMKPFDFDRIKDAGMVSRRNQTVEKQE